MIRHRCERCPETAHWRARQDSNLQPLDRLLAFPRSPPDREIPVSAGDFSVSWCEPEWPSHGRNVYPTCTGTRSPTLSPSEHGTCVGRGHVVQRGQDGGSRKVRTARSQCSPATAAIPPSSPRYAASVTNGNATPASSSASAEPTAIDAYLAHGPRQDRQRETKCSTPSTPPGTETPTMA